MQHDRSVHVKLMAAQTFATSERRRALIARKASHAGVPQHVSLELVAQHEASTASVAHKLRGLVHAPLVPLKELLRSEVRQKTNLNRDGQLGMVFLHEALTRS